MTIESTIYIYERNGTGFRSRAILLERNLIEITTEFKNVDTDVWESYDSKFIDADEVAVCRALLKRHVPYNVEPPVPEPNSGES